MISTFAIDPGNDQSAYVLIAPDLHPIVFAKTDNRSIMDALVAYCETAQGLPEEDTCVAIEMIASYGMPVGREVFETCLWIGRFLQVCEENDVQTQLIYRKDEKMTICHSMKANDSTISQALVDRFASGIRNHGKGTKNAPGWFYGFSKDVWQAYAVGITFNDIYRKE